MQTNVSIRLGNGTGGFTNAANVSAGDQPNSVAVGDFNGDGNQDFVVACLRSTVLYVRLGDGAGVFTNAPNVTVNADDGARSVVAADFNNDGRLDLAAAQWISSQVAIRQGDGAGNFSNAPDTDAGVGYDLEIGDFNRDGKLDFASISSTSETAYIRLAACNTLSIAAQTGVTRQQGSPVANSQIATTSAGTTVTVISANPSNGVTLSNIANSGGTVTADIVAGLRRGQRQLHPASQRWRFHGNRDLERGGDEQHRANADLRQCFREHRSFGQQHSDDGDGQWLDHKLLGSVAGNLHRNDFGQQQRRGFD